MERLQRKAGFRSLKTICIKWVSREMCVCVYPIGSDSLEKQKKIVLL